MTPRLDDATQPEHDDLAWLAFRYVAGELDADAESAFEARLDHDQAAREAVAGAVGLVGAVARASASIHVRFLSPRRAALAVLTTAAVLAVAVGLGLLPSRSRPGDAAVSPSAALALTWSGLWQRGEADDPASGRHDALIAWLDEPADPAPDPSDDAEGPPAWLFEAAALRNDAKAPGS